MCSTKSDLKDEENVCTKEADELVLGAFFCPEMFIFNYC